MYSSKTQVHSLFNIDTLFLPSNFSKAPSTYQFFRSPSHPSFNEIRRSEGPPSDETSDSSCDVRTNYARRHRYRSCRSDSEVSRKSIPPIGVFWDIENCQIPHGKSALAVVQMIREKFFDGYREAEFIVVCDVKKENSQVVQELNDAQISLMHVCSQSKNAADEKLRQAMRRFADIHGSPSAIILISSDGDFANDLSDLRHRKNIHIILIHQRSCSESLKICANVHYCFTQLVSKLPYRIQPAAEAKDLIVSNLPKNQDEKRIKTRLKFLSQNCGGKVVTFRCSNFAFLSFPTADAAMRAQKRMNGEVVFGNQIQVSYPDPRKDPLGANTSQNVNQKPIAVATQQVAWSSQLLFNCGERNQISEQPGKENKLNGVAESPWWRPMSASSFAVGSERNMKGEGVQPFLVPDWPCNHDENASNSSSQKSSDSAWSGYKKGTRRCRTPSPYMMSSQAKTNGTCPSNRRTTYPLDNSERYFNPISSGGTSAMELRITNLDQNMSPTEMKTTLMTIFSEHVMVLHMSIFLQSDNNYAAMVKVPSLQEAHYVISQLHRKKVGHRKIMISFAQSAHQPNLQILRWQIISLLKEVPQYKLPLFKFLELFESRYTTTVSVSDLNKLKDVCVITDENGRMVSLKSEHRNTPSPILPISHDVDLYCPRHYKLKYCPSKGWAEQEVPALPNVMISLKIFAPNLIRLVASHNNALPLASFCDCYAALYGALPTNESGVALEHLVTCVPGIELVSGNNVKYLKQTFTKPIEDIPDDSSSCVSPSLSVVLHQFSRELVDLLKTQPHCQLTFNRFIPTYHHHFGRQCRVADYGFTKLIDLLESLSSVIQVYGDGNKKMVTLSHSAQIRRFISDILRVLKSQPCKKMSVSELPNIFESVLGKPFDPVDYGLCDLKDLIEQLSDNTVEVLKEENNIILSLPKREQTPVEIERTKNFSKEVIELLGHAPKCSISFNKFIPAYHHHYGHQCRVSDFGFAKLIELFEAIPDIVKLERDSEGERVVSLTNEKKMKVLETQICDIVTSCYPPGLILNNLPSKFLWQFGYALNPSSYGASSLEQLIADINTVKFIETPTGKMVIPVTEALVKHLTLKVIYILLTSRDGKIEHSQLLQFFDPFHENHLKPHKLVSHMPEKVVVMDDGSTVILELTPLYHLVRRMCLILMKCDGKMPLSTLESAYTSDYQSIIQPTRYGFSSLDALIQSVPEILTLRGKGLKKHIILNRELVTKKSKDKMYKDDASDLFNFKTDEVTEWDLPKNTPFINLPEMQTLLNTPYSPSCQGLLPPFLVVPPDPSELPLPDQNLTSNSQIGQYSLFGDNPIFNGKSSQTSKRKLRLAAQFNTAMD